MILDSVFAKSAGTTWARVPRETGLLFSMKMRKPNMPSAEHRAHIRRFQRSSLTDAQDIALRGFVAWKRLNYRLMAEAQLVERGPKRRGKVHLRQEIKASRPPGGSAAV